MANIALQIERGATGSVGASSAVMFDTIVYSAGDISYDPVSGVISFNEVGRYILQWWVVQQSAQGGSGSVFALSSSQGDLLEGNNSLLTGEVSGVGILDIPSLPASVSLINAGAGTAYYASNIPLKASLVVVQDDFVQPPVLPAYGGLYEDALPFIDLPGGGAEVQVPFSETMPFDNITPGANTLIINESGDYRLDFLLLLSSAAIVEPITVYIRANGIVLPSTLQAHRLSTDEETNISGFTIETLAAGDIIDLAISSTNAFLLQLSPAQNATLMVTKVGV